MNCPTCNGPIIDGKCRNGTPKECLQKWWIEHRDDPRPIYSDEEFKAEYRDFLGGTWLAARLAAIEARAQATEAALLEQQERIQDLQATFLGLLTLPPETPSDKPPTSQRGHASQSPSP